MKKIFKRIACIGLVAGALAGAAVIAETPASACYVPFFNSSGLCGCRNFQSTGYISCLPDNGFGCTLSGDCGNGGGNGGDGRPR